MVDAAGLLLCARRGWLPRRPARAAAAFALVGAVTEAATVAALAADHRRGQISAAAGLPASAVPRPTKNSAGTTIAHR
jgi:hypothetical protein